MNNARMLEVANELEHAQAIEGGVRCVQVIVNFLRRGNLALAKNVRLIDGDKTRQYPVLEAKLTSLLGCRLHTTVECSVCK